MRLKKEESLKDLVTFKPNKLEPIHNWYWYKEGYSKGFVEVFLKRFKANSNSLVLDPFAGVGTTSLTCKEYGVPSVAFDVSPLTVLVSKVKTRDYDIEKLQEAVKEAGKWKFVKPDKIPKDKWLKRIFSKYALEDIVFYRAKIAEVKDEKIRDFLALALIDSAMKSSFAYKDGAFVRIVKKGVPPVKKVFKYKIHRMLKDLKKAELNPVPTKVEVGDARDIELEDESVDFVITSPPYLNKIEYTKIYKTEYALFFNQPETKLRAFVGSRVEDFGDMPPIAEAYFKDMTLVMKELYRVCKKDAKLAIVIGGGCFPEGVIEVDTKLANIAQDIGFKVDRILVARENWCTKKRVIKIGKMRESVVLLKKS
ncbi:MAG: hypothetical protein GOV02_02065 [Candidatus Aenigmarchaeota archaeon]|nr:hypothetical protein [Candidatus Aenigmarchaeota archaeon]